MELEPAESLDVVAMVRGSKANESDCSTELKEGAGESGKLEGAMAEIEVQGTTRFEGEIGDKVFEGEVSIIGSRDKVAEDKELSKGIGSKGDGRVKESREMFPEGKV